MISQYFSDRSELTKKPVHEETVGNEQPEERDIQTAPYGGFPRALNALAALSDVLSKVA